MTERSLEPPSRADVVIVGAGFAGLCALFRLRNMGLSVCVLEAGEDVGGTWYWNRYPGARCDVESIEYSYSFLPQIDQEWTWTERYASQPEILRYIQHVTTRLDLRKDIVFGTRVIAATWAEDAAGWMIETDAGDKVSAPYFVMATGCLSVPNWPAIPGVRDFAGKTYHTGLWPHEPVDFQGKRVGVIGTGSSACQSIPLIAEDAAELYVFQRTPNHVIPANNFPLGAEYVGRVKQRYPDLRQRWRSSVFGTSYPAPDRSVFDVTPQERDLAYEYRWSVGGLAFAVTFNDLLSNLDANRTAADFVNAKIREIVEDPDTAEKLVARDHPLATKRICVVTDYLQAFNRANVHLVSVRDTPIEKVAPQGVQIAGKLYELDVLVVATGFDSLTGALLNVDIRGRGGRTLKQAWSEGPSSYLGLMISGFPNFFTVTGPGSPSVVGNVIGNIEVHTDWIARCIGDLRRRGFEQIEPNPGAQEQWMQHIHQLAQQTVFREAKSWYSGHNIEGKPKIFAIYVGGGLAYAQHITRVADEGYTGFALKRCVGTSPLGAYGGKGSQADGSSGF